MSGNLETLVEVHCPLKSPKQKRSAQVDEVAFVEVFDISVGYNRDSFSAPHRVYAMYSNCQEKIGTEADPTFKLKVTLERFAKC